MSDDSLVAVLVAGAVAVGGYVLVTGRSAADVVPSMDDLPSAEDAVDRAATVVENGVTYSNPATSETATFEDANTDSDPTNNVDPTNYAPDVEEPGTGPSASDGNLADPGDSQVYGSAPEDEDDDLNTVGNMDDETASAFDRLANADSVEDL